jgi:hypothetical protein
VQWSIQDATVAISDTCSVDAMYIVAANPMVRAEILRRRDLAIDHEQANKVDMAEILALLP